MSHPTDHLVSLPPTVIGRWSADAWTYFGLASCGPKAGA